MLPSHTGFSEIKLRCVATYKEVIKEQSSFLNIFSYSYQAIEAQSTSFTSSSATSSAGTATISTSKCFINKPIYSTVTAIGVSIFFSWLFSYIIVLPMLLMPISKYQLLQLLQVSRMSTKDGTFITIRSSNIPLSSCQSKCNNININIDCPKLVTSNSSHKNSTSSSSSNNIS